MILFDYLDAFLDSYFTDVPWAGADLPASVVPTLDDSGIESVFGGLDTLTSVAGGPDGLEIATGGPLADGSTAAPGPADAWLSGNEWSGEAEIGGTSFTSGTADTSGEGNDVISVDGEVLDLP